MKIIPTIIAITTMLSGIHAAPSNPSAEMMERATPDFFPTACDIYSCGWCHWYYNNKPTPSLVPGGPAGAPTKCLSDPAPDGSQYWLQCPFCDAQEYCKGADHGCK